VHDVSQQAKRATKITFAETETARAAVHLSMSDLVAALSTLSMAAVVTCSEMPTLQLRSKDRMPVPRRASTRLHIGCY